MMFDRSHVHRGIVLLLIAATSAGAASVVALAAARHYSEQGPSGPVGASGPPGPPGPVGPAGAAAKLDAVSLAPALKGLIVLSEGWCPAGSEQVGELPTSPMLEYQIKNAVEDAL